MNATASGDPVAPDGFTLLHLTLDGADDVLGLRHVAGRAARLLGITDADATRVATSVSEVGRLAADHLPVRAQLDVQGTDLRITVTGQDAGAFALRAGDPVHTAVCRLMDGAEFGPGRIVMSKSLPSNPGARPLSAIRDQLLAGEPRDVRALLLAQNAELATTLIALRERETELVRLNAELAAGNRETIALNAAVRDAQRRVFNELADALRPPAPQAPGLELGIRYLPAQANSPTGGDLYDWLELPDGSLHVTVVDVQGHGVTGTRDALVVTHAVRTLLLEGHPLERILPRTDSLLRTLQNRVVATALLVRVDPSRGRVRVAGAGHPPALVVPADGTPHYLYTTGRPLGYPTNGPADAVEADLGPGDTVLLYTDGLTEVRHDLVEGMDTLVEAAAKARGMPMDQLLDTVLGVTTRGDALTDDTLLMAVRRTPG